MRPVLVALLFAVSACREEPDFDERYDETRKQIGERAGELDKELETGPTEGVPEDSDTCATGNAALCQ